LSRDEKDFIRQATGPLFTKGELQRIRDHSRLSKGDHSDHAISVHERQPRSGTKEFGRRARSRGGRSADEIQAERVGQYKQNAPGHKKLVNAILEGD